MLRDAAREVKELLWENWGKYISMIQVCFIKVWSNYESMIWGAL